MLLAPWRPVWRPTKRALRRRAGSADHCDWGPRFKQAIGFAERPIRLTKVRDKHSQGVERQQKKLKLAVCRYLVAGRLKAISAWMMPSKCDRPNCFVPAMRATNIPTPATATSRSLYSYTAASSQADSKLHGGNSAVGVLCVILKFLVCHIALAQGIVARKVIGWQGLTTAALRPSTHRSWYAKPQAPWCRASLAPTCLSSDTLTKARPITLLGHVGLFRTDFGDDPRTLGHSESRLSPRIDSNEQSAQSKNPRVRFYTYLDALQSTRAKSFPLDYSRTTNMANALATMSPHPSTSHEYDACWVISARFNSNCSGKDSPAASSKGANGGSSPHRHGWCASRPVARWSARERTPQAFPGLARTIPGE